MVSKTTKIVEPRKIWMNLKNFCASIGFCSDLNTLRDAFIASCLGNNINFKYLCKIVGTTNIKGSYDLCPEPDNIYALLWKKPLNKKK